MLVVPLSHDQPDNAHRLKRLGVGDSLKPRAFRVKNVARKLLPDILWYDHREPARYPHNGRTLTDDVADLFFSLYANKNVTDKVGPHGDLLDEFPYLGSPHGSYGPE
jgi:UDP:flavonoid glycosyltransferase YjiC (YdhE family)